ncbi:1-aminocyclopropane-1-carboxylate synthase-like protein 1 [Physella acuta]|uniref:1-aminocyclopropane-1-carboxylate synthase-like protein 1 n=1 Tax=Physella acuta TaxID=109671 RepID=UPI0027DC08B1|nr:1-aminocyclopropane-1-carboxylate synthase-like protein 1 [Physella acuta]XP_059141897.1 1-aminocyclopropane-1-carboxylate synthase-like protein 1 [Physella acuta]
MASLTSGQINTADEGPSGKFSISKRGNAILTSSSSLNTHVQAVLANSYDPELNANGIVNLGIAENKLCEDLMVEKMKSIQSQVESTALFYYDVNHGNASSKRTAKKFIETFFQPLEEIIESNIVIMNGMTATLENLAFSLADAGEYIMVPSPYYFRIQNDVKDRAGVNVISIPIRYKEDENGGKASECVMNSEILEEYYQQAVSKGQTVRAILLSNPNNPNGVVFSEDQLLDILQFAYSKNVHVISNEIYALSVFDPDVKFTSILSLPHPDPTMVHFTWGCSKDLGLSAYKYSMVYTRNPQVLGCCLGTSPFTTACGITQSRVLSILKDENWLSQIFLPTKYDRMRKRYQETVDFLRKSGAEVKQTGATMFVWMDLIKFMKEQTFEEEHNLFLKFMEKKVFVLPGSVLYNEKPGLFRVVYTLNEKVHKEGILRVVQVLQELQDADSNG